MTLRDKPNLSNLADAPTQAVAAYHRIGQRAGLVLDRARRAMQRCLAEGHAPEEE